MALLSALCLLAAAAHVAGHCCNSTEARLIRRNSLSCRNKQYILDLHNKIRNHVASGRIDGQPKAANMIQLRWSDELAKLAQARADTCIFDHGDLELGGGRRVGQNLAIVTSTQDGLRLNITQMVELWYNEVFQFGYNGGYEPNSGHYSQLIWGNTMQVGCGYTYFEEDHWYKMYFVCDYYPPGNYINQKPYDYDKYDCKKYGLIDSRKYSKLCTIDEADIPVCKTEMPDSEDNTTGVPNPTVSPATGDEAGNSTEDRSELWPDDEGGEGEAEGSMEEEVLTENPEILDLLMGNSSRPVGETEAPANLEEEIMGALNRTMGMLEPTMGALNRTTAENELFPPSNQTVLVRVSGDQALKLDWTNKEEFFRAAVKLLELLINRQIALSDQRL